MLDFMIGPVTVGELILITTVTLMCLSFFVTVYVEDKAKRTA